MEIDVTSLFYSDTWALSGSNATHGANAGPETWAASVAEAGERPLLSTPAQLKSLRDHCREFGAWDDAEIDAWDTVQCNAMLVQMVSLDKREMGLDDCDEHNAIDRFIAIEDDMAEGRIPSNMRLGNDGKIYYYLGS